jgi:hypothetical protein
MAIGIQELGHPRLSAGSLKAPLNSLSTTNRVGWRAQACMLKPTCLTVLVMLLVWGVASWARPLPCGRPELVPGGGFFGGEGWGGVCCCCRASRSICSSIRLRVMHGGKSSEVDSCSKSSPPCMYLAK